ncbi:C2HC-type zinc finger protein, partial [Litorimonas sp.]|uniref:C2HC-type zinc finger protein n=1 Tax=Litorimonas sp. TaxID=1892381 RepID=UPI003A85F5E5
DTLAEVEVIAHDWEMSVPPNYTLPGIRYQVTVIDDALAKLELAGQQRSKILELDPSLRAEQHVLITAARTNNQKVARTLRTTLSSLGDNISGASSSVGATLHSPQPNPVSAAAFHTRQPFPKFSGAKRSYPTFRKDWLETVSPHYPQPQQLRELCKCLPNLLEPEVKNMRTTAEVWEFLDEEYGKPMEAVAEIISELEQHKPSKNARSEPDQFLEFSRAWRKAENDLIEIGKITVLDHEPTITKMIQKLPSKDSRKRYVQSSGTPGNIHRGAYRNFCAFMDEERVLQRRLTRIEGETLAEDKADTKKPEDTSKSDARAKTKSVCYNCGDKGHRFADCPKPKTPGRNTHHTNDGQSGKSNCPICKEHHTFNMSTGPKPATRLMRCPEFQRMTPTERAVALEKLQG